MAGFHDLGVDILYVLISHLQSDKRLLRDLALSCRLLRDISQRFIVRDVRLAYSPRLSRFGLFLRTLNERPDLIAHVHRLELDLRRKAIHRLEKGIPWPEEQNNIYLLTRLPTNVRDFRYRSGDYNAWDYDLPLPLQWASENAHSHLRRIDWYDNMTIETLCKCLALPRINSIYCRELNSATVDLLTIPASSSSITELRIGSSSLQLEQFRVMLQSPRCLRKLNLEFDDELRFGLGANRISWLLEGVQNTLQELSISTGMEPWGSKKTDSAADFSDFSSLRQLQIPLRYLIGRSTKGTLCAPGLLSPRLCELTISFFSTDPKRPGLSPFASQNFEALTDWLGNFQNQKERSTDLTHVTLQESGFRHYYGDLCKDFVCAMDGLWSSLEDHNSAMLRLCCPIRTVE